MHTLLVDAGNSQLKWATLDDKGELSPQQAIAYEAQGKTGIFSQLLAEQQHNCDRIVLVTVLGEVFVSSAQEIARARKMQLDIIRATAELARIQNAYTEPEKLGADRLVAMVAAYHLPQHRDPKQALIVIDSGTATTIDAVDSAGKHQGGVILQGLGLCSSSLLRNTELLPQWNQRSASIEIDCFAVETTQAIASGCMLSVAGAIDSICDAMEGQLISSASKDESKPLKILTGGAAKYLLPYLKGDYQIIENLLMLGLKTISINSESNDK